MNRTDLTTADKAHVWHPFTPMRDWCANDHEPLVLVSGEGAILRDSEGREYIDGNSSIWTNVHGHNHPAINAAIRAQLGKVAHTSFLGFTNPPAIELAKRLVSFFPPDTLTRVFYSDDGSTAVEAAIKMAAQYWQNRGHPERREFVAFANAYHGDTMGASSLGGIRGFHDRFAQWQFPVARFANLQGLAAWPSARALPAAVVIEPLIQGAAGMQLWPSGMLRDLRRWCDVHDVLLIADEVMTGFGRTGTMFACEQEGVLPDFLCLAKGLTGGYLPLAATLTSEKIFDAFLGTPSEQKTFFYGHSYAGNQLGCAAALANLQIFAEENVLQKLTEKIAALRHLLRRVGASPHVREIRQCGFIVGIELVNPSEDAFGQRVCLAARKHGLLTRPIGNVVVLMPPFCITNQQLEQSVFAIENSIIEVCG